MCEVRSREKRARTKKKKYSGQQQKEIDCDEPHPAPNEKTQPIRWTERPTGALVGANSLWPDLCDPSKRTPVAKARRITSTDQVKYTD